MRHSRSQYEAAAAKVMREMGERRWLAWTRYAREGLDPPPGVEAARCSQVPHPTKPTTVFRAGRGSGKTRAGAEWLAHLICTEVGSYGLVGPWLDHLITECLEEGIYKIIPAEFRHWRGSVKQVDFANGSRLRLFHAERPGKVRGPNLMGKWVEEPAEMRFGMDAWSNANLATRIERPNGLPPQTFVTGTPKRVELIEYILSQVDSRPEAYHLTTGSMYDNIDNLSASMVEELTAQYEGTNLGDQELLGLMIEDVEGALLSHAQIRAHRVDEPSDGAALRVLSIDPGFSSKKGADEVGMVVVQRLGSGHTSIAEVIDDFSRRYGEGWGDLIVDKCIEHGVSVIVYEGNMVGQWVKEALEAAFKDRGVRLPRIEPVYSKKSKWIRAEPVAALAQKGRYRMVGTWARLESELTTWVPDTGMRSPNRLDAWAQAGRYLLIKSTGSSGVSKKPTRRVPSIG